MPVRLLREAPLLTLLLLLPRRHRQPLPPLLRGSGPPHALAKAERSSGGGEFECDSRVEKTT